MISNFILNQNLSLLYFNKKNNFRVGPVYTFMYNKLNKKITNLQDMYTSSLGIQFQYLFKSSK
jgi:hypothetical protein